MGDLSERDVEDVLGGVQPPGRDDLAPVVELTAWLHMSGEIEPPPAMRDDLFCQIEDGLRLYQRSSRRTPAHLRHHRSTTRHVRDTLAGSRRPIVSVAAAAALLVGVILAVRAGGPAHEPSAFVSPAAEGLRGTGADATTTTTTAPTTTSPPTSASDPAAPADDGSSLGDAERSTTADGTTDPSASIDVRTRGPQSGDDDAAPPTTERRWRERDDDAADSDENGSGDRIEAPPPSDATGGTESWDVPLSGWDFDLSEWAQAKALWDALEAAESEATGDRVEDPAGDDGDRDDRPSEVGDGERDGDEDGTSESQDVGDAEREPSPSD
jgi:hypothetical protein